MSATAFDTPLGICSIEWKADHVWSFSLPPGLPVCDEPPPWVARLIERVRLHLRGEFQDFSDVSFAWHRVSAFDRRVYKAALHVPAGTTLSYGDLAGAIGETAYVSRAVGAALGRNPWPLLVPCHRLVGVGGRMTGFSAPGGIRTKLRLLALEGAELFDV